MRHFCHIHSASHVRSGQEIRIDVPQWCACTRFLQLSESITCATAITAWTDFLIFGGSSVKRQTIVFQCVGHFCGSSSWMQVKNKINSLLPLAALATHNHLIRISVHCSCSCQEKTNRGQIVAAAPRGKRECAKISLYFLRLEKIVLYLIPRAWLVY